MRRLCYSYPISYHCYWRSSRACLHSGHIVGFPTGCHWAFVASLATPQTCTLYRTEYIARKAAESPGDKQPSCTGRSRMVACFGSCTLLHGRYCLAVAAVTRSDCQMYRCTAAADGMLTDSGVDEEWERAAEERYANYPSSFKTKERSIGECTVNKKD